MSRVIDAVLRLRDEFSKPLKKSIGLLTSADKAGDKARKSVVKTGEQIQKVGSSLTKSITAPTVAAGAAAIKTAADFESGMSQVQATMGITKDAISILNGQSVNTMDALSTLAKEMGASTKYSATEAAAAINNMAMAGYDVQTIYDRLPSVLSLASAGNMDLDYATQLVANGMAVMGDNCASARDMADKLAVTASNAYGSVSDFGEGLLAAGGQAANCGLSLTDTYTALGILGDNGIAATEGGTALRNALKNIYTPTDKAAKALKTLGIATSDAEGNLMPVQDVLKNLQTKLGDLSEAGRTDMMSQIFDTRTIAAANALIKNSGDRWDELSGKIDNAGNLYDGQGAAAGMAAAQLDNLSGQFTILKSGIEGASITLGEILLPYVKEGVDWIQGLVNKFAALSPETQSQSVKFVGMAAAAGPLIMILGKVVSASAGLLGAFSKVKAAGGLVKTVFLAFTSPAGIVVAALAAIALVIAAIITHLDEFKAAWGKMKTYISPPIENLKTAFDRIITVVQPVLSFIVGAFAPALLGAFEGIAEGTKLLIQSVADIINGLIDVLEGVITFITGVFSGDWDMAWNGIKQTVSGAIEFITGLIEGFLGILSGIGGAVSGAISRVTKYISGKGNDEISIPENASGTSYWRGGITKVNESGGEIMDLPSGTRIIPHDASKNTPIGSNITIAKLAETIVVREEADIDRIARKLVEKLRTAKSNMGGVQCAGMA